MQLGRPAGAPRKQYGSVGPSGGRAPLKLLAWLPIRTVSSSSAWSYQALMRSRPPKLPFLISTSLISLSGVENRSPLA